MPDPNASMSIGGSLTRWEPVGFQNGVQVADLRVFLRWWSRAGSVTGL